MSVSTIKTEVTKRLKSGMSKSDTYYELANDDTHDETLRRSLASKSPHRVRRRDRILNKAVCWAWVLILLLEVLGAFDGSDDFDLKTILSLAGSLFILVQLWRFNGDAYLPGIIWLCLGIYNTAKEVHSLPPSEPDRDLIVLFSWYIVGFMLLTIGLMYLVRKRVFGHYKWFKPAKDLDGSTKFE